MKKITAFILLIVIFAACTERIDIKLDDTYTRLVVEGYITTDTASHYVRLTKTTSYFYSESPPTVSGAEVSISDGDTTFQLVEKESGYYYIEPPVAGEIGKNYTLDIILAEPVNEKTHYTASSMINPINNLDSIGVEYNDNWEVWIVKCYAWDPPTTEFYMFRILKNGVLITDSIDEVMVTDDILYNGSYTNGIGVGWLEEDRPDERLQLGDTVEVLMSSITEDYTNFIWNIQDETRYSSPLFDGPPANIPGNLSNGALGYFAAYSNERASTIVNVKKE